MGGESPLYLATVQDYTIEVNKFNPKLLRYVLLWTNILENGMKLYPLAMD